MSDTYRLLMALLDAAVDLERALGELWPAFRDRLLDLAGRLEQAGLDADARAGAVQWDLNEAVELVLETGSPAAQTLIRRVIRDAAEGADAELPRHRSTAVRGATRTPRPADARPEEIVVVPVFYGTDRARAAGDEDGYYLGTRGTPAYGVTHVNVPVKDRAVGDLTEPKWWRLELSPDPAKHVFVIGTQELDRATFVNTLRESLATADARDVLIFVHGYNVSFVDAARRAAQVAVDLRFPGRTLMFSWASAADPTQYTVDEGTVDWSAQHFEAFLRLALTELGVREVHVIAHSMGNRALMHALERVDVPAHAGDGATLSQVIFAAPDIDRDRFHQLARAFHGRAKRYTLYASSKDLALKASKLVHGYPRAGEAGESLAVVDGVDTVDASTVDTSLIGLRHSYFGSKRSVLRDMRDLIAHGLEPSERFELREASGPPNQYWTYRQ